MPFQVAFTINISAIYMAISGLFLVLLSVDVIRGRWKYQEGFGEGVSVKRRKTHFQGVFVYTLTRPSIFLWPCYSLLPLKISWPLTGWFTLWVYC